MFVTPAYCLGRLRAVAATEQTADLYPRTSTYSLSQLPDTAVVTVDLSQIFNDYPCEPFSHVIAEQTADLYPWPLPVL